jgi:serine/tyrosine/threonine adenylyltransferase
MINFDNTYNKLPAVFHDTVNPASPSDPELIAFNHDLALSLGMNLSNLNDKELAQLFSGHTLPKGAEPIALAYAGHQFGQFSGQLGDGRAHLLGEVIATDGKRYDIQLKGSGLTKFSRGGDGKSQVGPVVREYIVSEAMHHLGVPTTRSLAAISTGDLVYRESGLPGAVLTRVASSHIRIGTFEYFLMKQDLEGLKTLADYAINRHYPDLNNKPNAYLLFLQKVIDAQASLIAKWMSYGFIHGVMNTDNMTISGETIDYGPCAFMDEFNANKVFSSIDRQGRYAYHNQSAIGSWNLCRLAECLLHITEGDKEKNIEKFTAELKAYDTKFNDAFAKAMGLKLGLMNHDEESIALVKEWLTYLEAEELDFTLSFRSLTHHLEDTHKDSHSDSNNFKEFKTRWLKKIAQQKQDVPEIKKQMLSVNPAYIPRNHQVEKAIQNMINGDNKVFNDLVTVLKQPFTEQPGYEDYLNAPTANEIVHKTFCGT